MWVRGRLAKADLQRDERGSRSPAPPEQSYRSQISGHVSAPRPMPQYLCKVSSWGHVDEEACAF